MSVKLNPGDLVFWDPQLPDTMGAPLLVSEDGQSLWFQFAPKPWHEITQHGFTGLTVAQTEAVLNGQVEWTGPGRIYKAYDEETGRALPDPNLELE